MFEDDVADVDDRAQLRMKRAQHLVTGHPEACAVRQAI